MISILAFGGCCKRMLPPNSQALKDEIRSDLKKEKTDEYLSLRTKEDKKSINDFNKLFHAESMRKEYYIVGEKTRFWWTKLESIVDHGGYNYYMSRLKDIATDRETIYRIKAKEPYTPENIYQALLKGYEKFDTKAKVRELEETEGILASMMGKDNEIANTMTIITKIRDEYFAIAVFGFKDEETNEIINHLKNLMKIRKTATIYSQDRPVSEEELNKKNYNREKGTLVK